MSDFIYQCQSLTDCSPIKVSLKKGIYKVELWGAQGGNVTGAEGGFGGYSKGNLHLRGKKDLYLFIGAHGFQGAGSAFTLTSYNGGGRGYFGSATYSAASGGGETDIRTSLRIEDRIIVAGGGGGASACEAGLIKANRGGSGGGIEGEDGKNGISKEGTYVQEGSGGKSDKGGISNIEAHYGKLLYGGNQSVSGHYGSGGGGGYYGGGAGNYYGASGGGGSSYADPNYFSSFVTIPGNVTSPNFYTGKREECGHRGSGAIRITPLGLNTCHGKNKSVPSILFYIFVCSS